MMRVGLRGVLVALLVATAVPGTSSSASSHPRDPGPAYDVPVAELQAALRCPRRLHHKVVLLVHGTSVTADENWGWNYAVALPHAGFDVCLVDLPDRELDDVQVSSEYVVFALRTIARRAHAKVDVVGLSQGALQPRWALRWWPDIRDLVDDYVSMAGTNHGSVFADASCQSSCLPSLWQQRVRGSHFLGALNRGDETPGNVSYTSVYSLTDEIIQPVAPTPVAALAGAADIAVQDICPGRYVGHIQSMWDAAYYAVVIDALSHPGPARPSRVNRLFCGETAMPYVDPVQAAVRTAELYAVAGVVQSQHAKVPAEPPLKRYAR